jgi:hypothetical protein
MLAGSDAHGSGAGGPAATAAGMGAGPLTGALPMRGPDGALQFRRVFLPPQLQPLVPQHAPLCAPSPMPPPPAGPPPAPPAERHHFPAPPPVPRLTSSGPALGIVPGWPVTLDVDGYTRAGGGRGVDGGVAGARAGAPPALAPAPVFSPAAALPARKVHRNVAAPPRPVFDPDAFLS